jgi:hypothetical protein
MIERIARVSLWATITALAVLTVSYTAAQETPNAAHSCSVTTIAGEWAFRNEGTRLDGTKFVGTGTYQLSKDGTSRAHLFTNMGGTILLDFSRTGTTTITPDCVLTQAWDDGGASAKCVVLANHTKIWCVYDQPGLITVELERISQPAK